MVLKATSLRARPAIYPPHCRVDGDTIKKRGLMSLVFYHSQSKANSFPLNRCWWLARHIIDHAVDAAHFVDDAVAHGTE